MRIISKFHDYYDSGSVYGIDKSILYLRNQSTILLPYKPSDIKIHHYNTIIGFCGKIYVAAKNMDLILFDKEFEKYDFEKIYNLSYSSFTNVYQIMPREISNKNISKWKIKEIHKEWTDLENNALLKSFFLKYKVPVFVIKKDYLERDLTLILNPSLKEYLFFRKFDTTQTFQEIEMFLTNELATDYMEIPKRTDEEIGTSKGFDKNSFKNSKGQSKKF